MNEMNFLNDESGGYATAVYSGKILRRPHERGAHKKPITIYRFFKILDEVSYMFY